MVDSRKTVRHDGDSGSARASIDALIERAITAVNSGDRATATKLAGSILADDEDNTDAEDLLAATAQTGEIRRLTLLVADLVDSTALSTRLDPEPYHSVAGRFRAQVERVIARHEGHVGSIAGDGVFAVFGHPIVHPDDACRAVRAAVDICSEVTRISAWTSRRFDLEVAVRVGVHRGVVYLDVSQDDVYGLAANLAARVSTLAPPGGIVVSDSVASLVRHEFELVRRPSVAVKGIAEPIPHSQVMGEQRTRTRAAGSPLIGRTRERRLIQDRWERLRRNTTAGTCLLVRGEPGIGKSRLAADAIRVVTESGGSVIELTGSQEHQAAGLYPIRRFLEQRCGTGRGTSPAEQLHRLETEVSSRGLDVVSAVPALAPILGLGPEHGFHPLEAEGNRLHELIGDTARAYLMACRGTGPGALIVDDVHWFDDSTLDLLEAVMADDQSGLLLVMTTRGSVPRDAWQVETIELARLDDAQTNELVDALFPAADADDRAQIQRRCDGVPFFIEEVVALLRADSVGPRVPDALYEPLLARLHTDRRVVPVVEAAALIGREFDRELLLAAVELDAVEVHEVLTRLTRAGVIETVGADTWRFRHELLREVAAELAPIAVQQALHSRVADALVQQSHGAPDWPLVAGHYEHAARPGDAARAYREASAVARQRGALREARSHLTRALDQLDLCPPGSERYGEEIAARLERGYLTATAEGAQSLVAAADFERCLNLMGNDLRDDNLLAALSAIGAYYCWCADLRGTRRVFDIISSGGADRLWFQPALDSSRGIVAWFSGDFATAADHFDRTINNAGPEYERRSENVWLIAHDAVAMAHEHLAWVHLIRGDLTSAERQLHSARERSKRLRFPQGPYNNFYAIDMEIWIRAECGQYDHAQELVGTMLELARRSGLDEPFWALLAATELAMVGGLAEARSGDPDRAVLSAQIKALSDAISVWHALGAVANRPFYWCVLAQMLIADGQTEAARGRIDTALKFATDTGVQFYSAELLRVRAQTQAVLTERLSDLGASHELAHAQGASLFELRTALDLYELRGTSAHGELAAAAEKFHGAGTGPELRRARALLGRGQTEDYRR